MSQLKPFLTIAEINEDSISVGVTDRYRVNLPCEISRVKIINKDWLCSDPLRCQRLSDLGLLIEDEEWLYEDSRTLSFLSLFCNFPVDSLDTLRSIPIYIVGCGGLGSRIALDLAALKIRHLSLVDPDTIDVSNLARMFYFTDLDVGKSKVKALSEIISRISKSTKVDAIQKSSSEWLSQQAQECSIHNNAFIFVTADGNDGSFLSEFPNIFSKTQAQVMFGGYWESSAVIGPIFSSNSILPSDFYSRNSRRTRVVRDFIPPSVGALNSMVAGFMQIEFIKSLAGRSLLHDYQIVIELHSMRLKKIRVGAHGQVPLHM